MWKPHIDKISEKLSKSCGMVFKLRHYVPLSTLKLIYNGMFNSILQYSLLNWGRASQCHLQKIKSHKIKINKALKLSCGGCYQDHVTPYFKEFGIFKLPDLRNLETAKFMQLHFLKKLSPHCPISLLKQVKSRPD